MEPDRPTATYAIEGGQVGRDRLRVLSSVLAPTTSRLLDRIRIPTTARCLDAGCGGGDVTELLACRVPDGHVLGVDRDPVKIAIAAAGAPPNVTYRSEDLVATVQREERYDVVYVRFVLCHLTDAPGRLRDLSRLLAPGGTLVVEDTHIAGSLCSPRCAAFDRAVEIYAATVRVGGGNPNIGPELPHLLLAAGLVAIGTEIVQPASLSGDEKRIQLLTLRAIVAAATQAGTSTAEEIGRLSVALSAFVERPDTLVSTAQIVQAWGTQPEGAPTFVGPSLRRRGGPD